MRTAHELILLFDSERWLLYAYPTRAPLFEDLPATCQRRFNVSRYVFFFIMAIRVAYYLPHLPFVVEYGRYQPHFRSKQVAKNKK